MHLWNQKSAQNLQKTLFDLQMKIVCRTSKFPNRAKLLSVQNLFEGLHMRWWNFILSPFDKIFKAATQVHDFEGCRGTPYFSIGRISTFECIRPSNFQKRLVRSQNHSMYHIYSISCTMCLHIVLRIYQNSDRW